jgi:MFS family permease
MNRKLLIALFVCNTMPSLIGNSLLPLLPAYIRQMGGDTSISGIYLALAFGALAAGTLASGWLTGHVMSRKLWIITVAVTNLTGVFLMGQAVNFWLFTLLTMMVWFVSGIGLATSNTLAGMYASPQQRGRIFGVLSMSTGVAQISSGLLAGRIVDHWGYTALFTLLALTQIAYIVAGLLLENRPAPGGARPAQTQRALVNRAYWFLIAASTLIYIVVFSSNLGLSVSMTHQGFSATAISSTLAVGGLIALPLPLIVGWLSDRFERRNLLALCYVAPLTGALLLSQASELWHFWLVQILFASTTSTLSVGSALVTDMTAPGELSAAISRFNTTRWVGAVIGFSSSGVVVQVFGFQAAFLLVAVLPFLSILLILPLNHGAWLRAKSTTT